MISWQHSLLHWPLFYEQNELYVAEQLLIVNFKCFICNKKCSTDTKNNHHPKFSQLTDLVLGIYGPLPILFNPLLSELNAQCDHKKCQHLNGHPLTSMLLAMPWHSSCNSSCTVCSKGFSNFGLWRNYLSRDSIYTSVKTIRFKQIQLIFTVSPCILIHQVLFTPTYALFHTNMY